MKKTYVKQCPDTIKKLFNGIAARYDLANSIMSVHMHSVWNKRLVHELMQHEKPAKMLDVCAGTGDICRRALQYFQNKKITPPQFHLVDFSSEMLALAKDFCMTFEEAVQEHFFFYEQDVHTLCFDDNSFDIASCAYGIRNVQDPKKCLQELHRVLRPKGKLGILELTRPKNWLLRALHKTYTSIVLPFVGKCISADRQAYSYLSTSIQHFVSPDELKLVLLECGFEHVFIKPLQFGIATLIVAQKK